MDSWVVIRRKGRGLSRGQESLSVDAAKELDHRGRESRPAGLVAGPQARSVFSDGT